MSWLYCSIDVSLYPCLVDDRAMRSTNQNGGSELGQSDSRASGSGGVGTDMPTSSGMGSGMFQYVQSFVMEFKNADCTEWKQVSW